MGQLLECHVCGNKNQNQFQKKKKELDWDNYRCLICDFEFWWPMQPEFNDKKRRPADLVFDESICRVLEERHTACLDFLGKLDRSRELQLLDIGSRGGAFVEAVSRLGIKAFGIDVESGIVELAKKFHRSENFSAVGVYEFEPLNHGRFDIVTSFDVLEHIGNPERFIISALNLLKPGGYLVLSIPNFRRFGGHPKENIAPYQWSHWTSETISKILRRKGCKIIKIKSIEASPRQIIDFLKRAARTEKEFSGSASENTVMDVSYRKGNSPLRSALTFFLSPVLFIIKKAGRGHTLFVVAQHNKNN